PRALWPRKPPVPRERQPPPRRGMRLAQQVAMPTNDFVDPTVQEAEQRVERAKDALNSRVAALKDKLIDVKDKLDLPGQIANHPLPSVGIAFVLGMIAGRLRAV